MSAPTAESYDLKKGQLFNLLLVTFASTVGFWAWTIVGPLAKYYAGCYAYLYWCDWAYSGWWSNR